MSGLLRKIEAFEPSPRVAYPMLAATVFLWAVSVIIVRLLAVDGVPPIGLSWWRWTVGGLLLLPFAWPDVARNWELIRSHWRVFALLGFLQMAGGMLLFLGVAHTTAINAALVNAAQPAITALCAGLLLRHRLGLLQSIGVASALGGVTVMVSRADLNVLVGLDFQIGDPVVLLAIMSYALYVVMLQRMPRGVGLSTTVFLIAAFGSVLLLPAYIAETVIVGPVPFTGQVVVGVLALAVLASILSIYMWNGANRAVGPNRAAVFVNLFPIYAALLAIPILGEEMFAYHVAGFALVAAGILLVIRGHR